MVSVPGFNLAVFLDVALECAKCGVPKRPDLFQLMNQLPDLVAPAGGEFVDTLATDLSGSDESGTPQHPGVLDDRGTADRKAARQISGATRLRRQASEQFSPSWICQGSNGGIYGHRKYETCRFQICQARLGVFISVVVADGPSAYAEGVLRQMRRRSSHFERFTSPRLEFGENWIELP